MKIQPYITKLQSSTVFKDFQHKYEDAFLVAGFFVIDFESGKNVHQIDYYVPSKKKFAAFTLDRQVQLQLLDSMDKKKPNKLEMKTNIDLDALQGIIQDEMKNRSITQTIKKMIAVVQSLEGKNVWSVNCILSGMDILKVHVEDNSRTVLKMERSSIFDYIKRLPTPGQPQPGQPADGTQTQTSTQQVVVQPQGPQVKPTKQEIENKIAQLDKLKEMLKKEEVELDNVEAIENEKAQVMKKSSSSAKSKKKSKK